MSFNSLKCILGPIKSVDPSLVNIKQNLSKSTKLFSEVGFVRYLDGKPVLLNALTRSLTKLKNIIHEEMEKVNAQEVVLPILVKESLLEAAGHDKIELFRLKDRTDKKLVLSPTHEEVITFLLSSDRMIKSHNLPYRLYQIGPKFRDEAHPKHGLIRAKEFIMKDLYCFDNSPESRSNTYNELLNCYDTLFQRLQIPYECVESASDNIKCEKSHEFHFLSDIGEDEIMICNNCNHNVNTNMVSCKDKCSFCSSSNINITKGIEVGHTFSIGVYYSERLNATFTDSNNTAKFLELSCYGIGLTRILAAAVEVMSTEKEIRWPHSMAPYSVCIIPPKCGSKEESVGTKVLEDIYKHLNQSLKGDVVVDDRTSYTIGKRLHSDKKFGFPYIIVIGGEVMKSTPKVELFDVNLNETILSSPSEVASIIIEKMSRV